MCAYANNQWDLQAELVDDLAQTSFRKALDLANGTISVVDPDGVCFTRVWCCYEIYVSLKVDADRLKYDVRDCYATSTLSPTTRAANTLPSRPVSARAHSM